MLLASGGEEVKCTVCGKRLERPAIREETRGRVYHYCSADCLLENLHRRDDESARKSGDDQPPGAPSSLGS
ncbi:MAG: hypothetical protein ACE5IB_02340 [Candidatus Geothermarchaeales archaeon]